MSGKKKEKGQGLVGYRTGNEAMMRARVEQTGSGIHGDRRTKRVRTRGAQRRRAIEEFRG